MRFVTPFLICTVIGVFLWQSFNITAYRNYHSEIPLQSSPVIGEQTFLEKVDIVQSPQKEDWLIRRIDWAQQEIKVAVYMFTVPSLMDALLRAKRRGVDVEVIMEGNPYNATSINREAVQFFKKNSIDFYETDNQYFSFMHAKYMIIDESWLIATANWTRSSFSSNREFFILWKDSLIREELRNIFEKDFQGNEGVSHDTRILVWPTNARERIIQFAQSAIKTIKLYMPSLTDEKIILEFQKICSQGKMIYVILDKNDENTKKGNIISQNWCPQIRVMKTPSLHGKALIIDEKKGFIGSFNFTKNSLENNREIGIFLNGETILNIVNIFDSDWQKSVAF